MEIGTVRKLRYVLLAFICVVLTLTVSYYNPDLVPHRVRQLAQSSSFRRNYVPPPKIYHPSPLVPNPASPDVIAQQVKPTVKQVIPQNIQKTAQQPATQPTTTPAPVVTTAPSISPRLRIVKYEEYPMQDAIECVLLRTAINNAKICLHPVKSDIHVSGSLKRSGVWEPHIVNSVKSVLEKCPVCQFIDIGANIGVFSVSVASMGRKVIAVEPLPDNLFRLTKAIQLNSMQKTVTVVTNALSDVYENVTFWQPKTNAGGTHTASAGVNTFDAKIFNPPKGSVPTVKLDDLLPIIPFRKAVMKIDIEGYEPKAINGAGKLFDTVHISHVYMEWSGKGHGQEAIVQPMLNFFSSRGYKPTDGAFRSLNPTNAPLTYALTAKWPFDIIWVKS